MQITDTNRSWLQRDHRGQFVQWMSEEMAQQLILSMTYFKIPEDGSGILGRTPLDPETAFVSFLCSEPQFSSVGPSDVASASSLQWEWLLWLGDAVSTLGGYFKTRLWSPDLGQSRFGEISSLSQWSFLLPHEVFSPLWIFGVWVPLPPLRHHVISDTKVRPEILYASLHSFHSMFSDVR